MDNVSDRETTKFWRFFLKPSVKVPREIESTKSFFKFLVFPRNWYKCEFLDIAFSKELGSGEREVIHHVARKFGLKSKSYGKGAERHVVIGRTPRQKMIQSDIRRAIVGKDVDLRSAKKNKWNTFIVQFTFEVLFNERNLAIFTENQ